MKTIKTLVLVTLISFSTHISAFTANSSDDIQSVSKQIQRFLNIDSELRIYDETIVTVKFKLNANNEIIIISDDSGNHDITKFIRTSLNLKELTMDKDSNNKIYYVPVRFLPTVD
ncbi:hypothetical protein [Winogradskyella schleiferi]|uniref:hypothetical protein n=1 Tax=Winogradskyella schleiferi TaxID=2686078 RepID=UPI0015BCBD9F|nr:hypothetical protein [Winogradskyella schleiferi]